MRWLALAVLGACSFSPGAYSQQVDARGGDTSMPIDALVDDTSMVLVDSGPDALVLPDRVRSIDIVDAQVAGGPHVGFPLLVSLGNQPWLRSATSGGDVARDDGFDIYFSQDLLGATRYSFEVESYDPTTGTLVAWVKVPLAATSVIYLHYGNASITTNQAMPTDVWTAGYEMVAHMNGGGDSTTKNTLAGSLLIATGQIGGARSFDGAANVASAGSNAAVDDIFAGGGAVEAWFNADTLGGGGWGRLFDKTEFFVYLDNSNPGATNAITFYHACTAGNGQAFWHFNNIANLTGAWHQAVLVYDKDNVANVPVLYVDGTAITATNVDPAVGTMSTDNASTLYIGGRGTANDRGFDGILDELRLSSTVQSADWYLTQYRNQSNPGAFYTVSSQL